jgi:hypothetical protein
VDLLRLLLIHHPLRKLAGALALLIRSHHRTGALALLILSQSLILTWASLSIFFHHLIIVPFKILSARARPTAPESSSVI